MPDLIAQLDDIIASGNFLKAYDLSRDHIAKTPGAETNAREPHILMLKHRALLALIRTGATDRAVDMFNRWRMADADPREEILGLRARLLKEIASQMAEVDDQQYFLCRAAESYRAAYYLVGGPYLGINAATMHYLTAQDDIAIDLGQKAFVLAEKKLHACLAALKSESQPGLRKRHQEGQYYSLATMAEAQMILGDQTAAQQMLSDAAHLAGDNFAARATTLKQLDLISRVRGTAISWVDSYRPPPPLHYTGHMFAISGPDMPADCPSELSAEKAHTLAAEIAAQFNHINPSAVIGSLAAGSDILCAEEALRRHLHLTVILPCTVESFIASSIWPFGSIWLARFNKILDKADQVIYASNSDLPVDSISASLASEVAMGHCLQTAQSMAAQAHQLAIWDGRSGEQAAGTHFDVARWRVTGAAQTLIDFPGKRRKPNHVISVANSAAQAALNEFPRAKRVMLFADIQGFSKIAESRLPAFLSRIWVPIGETIADLAEAPIIQNTWGDAVFLVFEELEAGAEAALAIKACFRRLISDTFGTDINIRIGLHYGPVWNMADPLTGKPEIVGRSVSMASRIENIALPGYIYVTETFARAITLAAGDLYRCEYVESAWPKHMDADTKLFTLQHMAQSRNDLELDHIG